MGNMNLDGEGYVAKEDLIELLPGFKEVSDSDEENAAYFDKKIDEELEKMEQRLKEEEANGGAGNEEKKEGEVEWTTVGRKPMTNKNDISELRNNNRNRLVNVTETKF